MSSSQLIKLCSALAFTATCSLADKLSLAELMNLQTNMVDHLDEAHSEHYNVDDHREHSDEHHTYHEHLTEAEEHENELEWETISEKSDDTLKCKDGQTKVGCCKCVHDDHVVATHVRVPETKSTPLAYHGMSESTAAPTVPAATTATPAAPVDMTKANDPNFNSWFSSDTDESSKTTKQDSKKKQQQKDDDEEEDRKKKHSQHDKKDSKDSKKSKKSKKDHDDDEKSVDEKSHPIYGQTDEDWNIRSQKKQKFTMSTSAEQARGKSTHQTDSKDEQRETEESSKSKHQKDSKDTKDQKKQDDDDDKKMSEKDRQSKQEEKCPEGFTYESHTRQDQAPWIVEACRIPMSYDLNTDNDEHRGHHDGHYSYGRYLETCAEHFVRNGCCTCTPHCPEGMVLHESITESYSTSNFVCLIFAGDHY